MRMVFELSSTTRSNQLKGQPTRSPRYAPKISNYSYSVTGPLQCLSSHMLTTTQDNNTPNQTDSKHSNKCFQGNQPKPTDTLRKYPYADSPRKEQAPKLSARCADQQRQTYLLSALEFTCAKASSLFLTN